VSDKTGIQWTDATWNPVRGCSRVSEGCRHCYAERVAARFSGPGHPYEGLIKTVREKKGLMVYKEPYRTEHRWNGVVRMVPEHLADPLRWRKPRRIFVNSMSDLFHEALDDEQIDRALAVMLLAPHHTFQVLTKRSARMLAYLSSDDLYERVVAAADEFRRQWPRLGQIGISDPARFPARWIWWGVSVENQAAADKRIPHLLATPAAVRFLSCEPLLGEVDAKLTGCFHEDAGTPERPDEQEDHSECAPRISWVIAGCESGPGARPAQVDWYRSLRDQCATAGVPFFLKQAVETPRPSSKHSAVHAIEEGDGSERKPGGVIGLPYLDGVQHAAFPATSTPAAGVAEQCQEAEPSIG
jgi:protein gp37